MRQAGMFGLSDHLKRLSAHGDPLEELGQISSTSRHFTPFWLRRWPMATGLRAAVLPVPLWRCSRFACRLRRTMFPMHRCPRHISIDPRLNRNHCFRRLGSVRMDHVVVPE
jgi:hypothetical protein